MSLIRPSLVRFKNALVLTHSAAFSPMYVIQRSINDAAHFAPIKSIKLKILTNTKEKNFQLICTFQERMPFLIHLFILFYKKK